MRKLLGKTDVYIETTQKWAARFSSIMIWIGFFSYVATLYGIIWLVIGLTVVICAVILLVWFDIKFILPTKMQFLGDMNPYLNEIKNDIKEIKNMVEL